MYGFFVRLLPVAGCCGLCRLDVTRNATCIHSARTVLRAASGVANQHAGIHSPASPFLDDLRRLSDDFQ